jgi:hypothetical protein
VSFHLDCTQTIQALKRARGDPSSLDPSVHCLRGLEKRISSKYNRERRLQQLNIIRLVLKAQEEQRKSGIIDPERIKSLSKTLSRMSRDQAFELAELDARASQECPRVNDINREANLVLSRKRSPLDNSALSSKRQLVDFHQQITLSTVTAKS